MCASMGKICKKFWNWYDWTISSSAPHIPQGTTTPISRNQTFTSWKDRQTTDRHQTKTKSKQSFAFKNKGTKIKTKQNDHWKSGWRFSTRMFVETDREAKQDIIDKCFAFILSLLSSGLQNWPFAFRPNSYLVPLVHACVRSRCAHRWSVAGLEKTAKAWIDMVWSDLKQKFQTKILSSHLNTEN